MFFSFGHRGHAVHLSSNKTSGRVDGQIARPAARAEPGPRKSVDQYRVLFERERAKANEERSRAERLEAALKVALRDLAQAEHEFKNFHARLCDRFDYVHDEIDWKRDQVSLEEWIATSLGGNAS